MKTRTLILVALIMAVLIIAGSCATDPMKYISKDYEIYGTWVNPDYNNTDWHPKVVFNPNGKLDPYRAITATKTPSQSDFVITNKWIDNMGNVYYTLILKFQSLQWYELLKISNSGKTLEINRSQSDYPKEIDPKRGEIIFIIVSRIS